MDDNRRCGDIDLLICPGKTSQSADLMRKIRFMGKLERAMGERKIDVIIETDNDHRSIVQIAHKTGIQL